MELTDINQQLEAIVEALDDYTLMEYKDTLHKFVRIGFDKLHYYNPMVIKYVKMIMNIAISKGLAEPYNFGKGKGKYITKNNLSPDEVATSLESVEEVKPIVDKYFKYVEKLRKARG